MKYRERFTSAKEEQSDKGGDVEGGGQGEPLSDRPV